jgi:hypothetical protein
MADTMTARRRMATKATPGTGRAEEERERQRNGNVISETNLLNAAIDVQSVCGIALRTVGPR